jgi:hypothetical protein
MTDTRTCNTGDRRQICADCKGSDSRQGGRVERGRRAREDRTDGEKITRRDRKRGVDIVICEGFYSQAKSGVTGVECSEIFRYVCLYALYLAVDSLSPRERPGERSEKRGKRGVRFKAWG